ncbi:hypothetical protein JHD50_09785 [Sulfurimonas sp. MAG313]|nr:hypothetical protein [Sulfurimonas sp. MAG313]MDF1881589.1 hypothetical protein [Sulfurimonas sp. MAG313]
MEERSAFDFVMYTFLILGGTIVSIKLAFDSEQIFYFLKKKNLEERE